MSKRKLTLVIFAAVTVISICILAVSLPRRLDEPYGEVAKNSEEPYCLLVLGEDRVSGSTDVMMLVAFDSDKERICVMQIPRDTYADFGNAYHKKINSARDLLGGEKQLCSFLSESLGISIDGYLSMDLDGFAHTVDAVGGVEMELDRTFYYNDPEQGLYIYLQKGRQQLDGKKAEMLVRYRSGYRRGDLSRLDVQKQFLKALFKKLKDSVSVSNAYTLAKEVLPYVDTDVNVVGAVSLGLKALKVDDDRIYFLTLPGGEVVGKSGGSFYVMSRESTERVLEEYFTLKDIEVDRNRAFRNSENADFYNIYDSEAEYLINSGNEE